VYTIISYHTCLQYY